MLENIGNKHSDILLTCIEEKLIRDQIVFEHHSLVRVLSGVVKVIQTDTTYTFNAGDTFFVPRNQLATFYKYAKDGNLCKTILITLTKERLKRFYTKDGFTANPAAKRGIRGFERHPLLDSLFASINPYFELDNELPEKIISLKIEEAVTILRSLDKEIDYTLADFSDAEKISLEDFMGKNYLYNLSMEKFAKLTGRSLSTFKRDFKKIYHTTPQMWLTQKRLEFAYYQLVQKQKKPVDVYFEAGFENLSHFSYAFKKQFGHSPRYFSRHISTDQPKST